MKSYYFKFIIAIIAGAIINVGIMAIFINYPALADYFWVNLLFFSCLTLLVFWGVTKILFRAPDRYFLAAVLGGFMIKMFGSLLFFVIIYLLWHPEVVLFLIPFAFYYLLFTILETVFLVQISNEISKRANSKR
jgi:hypothetical protein